MITNYDFRFLILEVFIRHPKTTRTKPTQLVTCNLSLLPVLNLISLFLVLDS